MKNYFLISLFLVGCIPDPEAGGMMDEPEPENSPRVLDGLAAFYRFQEGDGFVIHDTSRVQPAFDLQIDNLVTNKWIPGGGIEIVGPSVITSTEVAEKVFVACVMANAVTVEVWAEPTNITQNATLFTYSKQNARNVTLSQTTAKYQGSIMTTSADPMVKTGQVSSIQTFTNVAAVAPQHVVYTRDASGSAIYVDGVDTKNPMQQPPTTPPTPTELDVWSPAYQLALGNETNGGKPWLGKIYLAAVYCKRLSPTEVTKNFTAGYRY